MMMVKNDEVEVCSEEEGFKGAWFKAVLEEKLTKSGRKKIRVRYLTLLHANGSSPLIEFIDQKFIRPVPPKEKFYDIVLEEGVAVDADHKDGWWTGVVIKEMEQEKFLVYFKSPPEILQFDKKQLRAHIDWTGWLWVRPKIEVLWKSMFCRGTMVEVRSVIDKEETRWSPSMIVTEIEEDGKKMFIVKYCNKDSNFNGDEGNPNETVDASRVRPTPHGSPVKVYKLLDGVEVFRGSSWRQGLVRGILSEKRYMVSVETTKEESVFKHAELRPLMEWEDGVWRKGSIKQQPVKETPSNSIRKKSMRSCSSGVKPMTPKTATKCMKRSLNFQENVETIAAAEELRKKLAGAVTSDDTPSVVNPQVNTIAKESVSSVTPVMKQPVTETGGKTSAEKTLEQARIQNVCETDSTQQKMPEEENSKENSKKRKRDPNETGMIPNMVNNSAAITHVDETQAGDTVTSLPFAKKSPYWKTCESMESFKSVPQRPHFSPLCEAKEDFREWSAVGMMVTFYGLLDEVKDLKLDDSPNKLNSFIVSFAELEKHGFDVEGPRLRVRKLLSLQDDRTKNTEEMKYFEKKIEEGERETRKAEEELAELKLRFLELQRLEALAKEKKEAGDKNLVEMKSSVETIGQKLGEVELEFQKTVSAPW